METEPNSLTEGQPAPNNENSSPDSVQPSADIGASLDKTRSDSAFAAQIKDQEEKDRNRIAELRSRLGVVNTPENKADYEEPVTKPIEKSQTIEPTQFGVAHVPGEKLPEDHPLNQRESFSYTKEGPKFTDVLSDSIDRDNVLSSKESDIYPKPPIRTFTEREGLADLNKFLDKTIELATQKGNKKVEETVRVFKRDLVYIGEPELKEALQSMASGIVSSAENGENVYLYISGKRSERYISLRILEEVDQLTTENSQLRQRIHFSENPAAISKALKESGGRGKAIVVDDFSVSGTRIDAAATNAFRGLVQAGFSPEEASRRIEINLIADKTNRSNRGEGHHVSAAMTGEKFDYPIKTSAYYGISESRKNDGSLNVFTGMSVSGSHSSTDYGYENVLDEFWHFQIDSGGTSKMPLLHSLNRPYEMEGYSGNYYKDKQLQARWNMIMHKYQLR